MGPIDKLLSISDLNEIMINGPHDVFYQVNGVMKRHDDIRKEFTLEYLERCTKLCAFDAFDSINKNNSILSASLPLDDIHLARVQVVVPPSCDKSQYIISIRKPSTVSFTLEDYDKSGFFNILKGLESKKCDTEENDKLKFFLKKQDVYGFMKLAVKAKKNIVISGGTNSGKTRFTNCLIGYMGMMERIITLENTRECLIQPIDKKRNMVNLLTSKASKNKPAIGYDELLQACLRLNPDRIILSEIRGAEAFDFLSASNTDHRGSITSIHADSANGVYDRLLFMLKMSDAGRALNNSDIYDYCRNSIDIIMHCGKSPGKWRLEEVIFND